jgi:sigma-E factor negative regulatory protein RseC
VREEGIVLECCGDRAKIKVERSSACGHCSARALCHPFGEMHGLMEVANPVRASEGQRVVVVLEPTRLVKNSLVVYGIPLAALIAGAAVGAQIPRLWVGDDATDIGAIAGAATFLGLALIIIRAIDRGAAKKVETLPTIVAIAEQQAREVGADGARQPRTETRRNYPR